MSSSQSPPDNPWAAESAGAGGGQGGSSSTAGSGRGGGGGRKRGKGGGGGRGGGGGGGRGGGRGGAGAALPASGNNSNPKVSASTENAPSTSKRAKNSNKGGRAGGGGGDSNKNDSNAGKSKQQRNKSNTKEQQPPEAPKISAEELAKQEQAKRVQEEALAEGKRVELTLKTEKARTKQRLKAQQQLDQDILDASNVLESVVESTVQHVASRNTFGAERLSKFRKDFETDKKKLKTDLKKCTAFVKKIKSGSAWSMRPAELQKDLATLNLSRYVEEVAGSILETKPKLADIPVIVALCAAMHERYTDFMPNLTPGLWNVVQGKGAVTPDTTKLRRIYIRLLTEFLLHGLVPESKQLVACIAEATGGKDGSYAVQDANLVVAFGKAAGFEIFGGTPQFIQAAMSLIRKEHERFEKYQENNMPGADTTGTADAVEEEPKTSNQASSSDEPLFVSSGLLEKATELVEKVQGVLGERGVTPEISEVFTVYCMGAYKTLATSLVQSHTKLQKIEKRCEQDRLLSGTLAEAREKGLADARKLKESLQKSVETLSDVLGQHVPVLEEDQDDAEEGSSGIEVWTKTGGDDENDFGPYDDEETRAFYCDIPDLLATTPAGLLGMTPEAIEVQKAANIKKYGAEAQPEMEEGDTIVAPASMEELEAEENEMDADGEDDEGDKQEGGAENKDTPHYKLMVLLEQELPECNRREQLDEITEKFCTNHGSSKTARKRLHKVLFLVPRSRLDLLPFYSRMTATLDRVWLDIAAPLVTDLEQQFHGQAKFKKNQNIDSRMRTARYVGELTKFEVAPPMVALRCMKRCLEDFTGSNVDVACCLLESCGRFLYRKNITSARLTTLMDSMTRLSKVKNLDERSQSLIIAAFYSVKPPPSGPRKQVKVYPPLESYLRYLLMVRLEPHNASIVFVTKQIVRFPWSDPVKECGALVVRVMLKACRKGRYKTIQAIAAVAAAMRTQRAAGEVAVRLIDAVLEELRWALEHPNFRDQQRTITYARLLGELCCESQISIQTIFQQLYRFINLGHEISQALRDASERLALGETSTQNAGEESKEQLPVFNSASGVSQTIQEDEEMEESELETTHEKITEAEQQPVAVSRYSAYDPRVPSPVDPPNSAFRIKLVCTLLEVVAKSIVTRNSLPRLKGFLAAFQRYLFTKTALPTDVEFSLLDSFDILDSHWRRVVKGLPRSTEGAEAKDTGFPRFKTWLEAHNATVAVEESEALLEIQKRASVAGVSSSSIGDMGESIDDDDATTSSMDEDAEEISLSYSARDSVTEDNDDEMDLDAEDQREDDEYYQSGASEGEDDEESESEGASDEEDDLEEDDEEEFDEEAYMRQLEDEAFERELRRVTMDALEKGKNASRKQVADNMPSGSQTIKKKTVEAPKTASTGYLPDFAMALSGKSGISFQLLKKGNKGKVEAKEFIVPMDTNLAVVATKQDDAAARERHLIKQRVLQYEADSAIAEISGGNVYLEQEKLQVIRNRPLSMDDIDRNFGTSGGNLSGRTPAANTSSTGGRGDSTSTGRGSQTTGGRGGVSSGGRGRGRGRGRSSSSGRGLF